MANRWIVYNPATGEIVQETSRQAARELANVVGARVCDSRSPSSDPVLLAASELDLRRIQPKSPYAPTQSHV